ncbi:hypothetical protein D9M69_538630 [compost metagenome]
MDQGAGDDGRQAGHVGDRQVQLGGDQRQGETEGDDGQETGFLGDVQEVVGRREIRRGQCEEPDQNQSRDCRAVLFQDAAHRLNPCCV